MKLQYEINNYSDVILGNFQFNFFSKESKF